VTIVQYRDKTADTAALIATAKALHTKCKAHGVPLVINDRVDIALAVNCEGVHLGQDDMSVSVARQILGPDKIIGATVSSVQEARIAVEHGADYLGIGTLYATQTKKNTKDIIGIKGTRNILRALDSAGDASRSIKTVCIGGINASNIPLIIHQLLAPTPSNPTPKTIDGVAVVSAIIGAPDPKAASQYLRSLLTSLPPFKAKSTGPPVWLESNASEISHLLAAACRATKRVRETTPLSHNMTNLVVQNFAANVALAVGASPIMANYGPEAIDLSALGGGLVINMGTVTPEGLANCAAAIQAYNTAGGPIILDPVGAGATTPRKDALAQLLRAGYFDLIKGNEREILQVALTSGLTLACPASTHPQPGVDSGTPLFSPRQRAALVSHLAARERTIVLMTGATDVISDGTRTYRITNGHAYLGLVTGTGCTLGTVLAAYLAANPADKLHAAVAALLHFEIASEEAARSEHVRGPGTFVPAFLDALFGVGVEVAEERATWEGRARVEGVREVDGGEGLVLA